MRDTPACAKFSPQFKPRFVQFPTLIEVTVIGNEISQIMQLGADGGLNGLDEVSTGRDRVKIHEDLGRAEVRAETVEKTADMTGAVGAAIANKDPWHTLTPLRRNSTVYHHCSSHPKLVDRLGVGVE